MLDDGSTDFAPGAVLDAEAASAIAGVSPLPDRADQAGQPSTSETGSSGLRARFSTSLKKTQARAQPVIERRGTTGMFLLCFAPTPMGTAAAYLGGLMRFGFSRYLLASFAAKYLLAGIIVVLALMFSDVARAVQLPEIDLPDIDLSGLELPFIGGGDEATASPVPTASPDGAAD